MALENADMAMDEGTSLPIPSVDMMYSDFDMQIPVGSSNDLLDNSYSGLPFPSLATPMGNPSVLDFTPTYTLSPSDDSSIQVNRNKRAKPLTNAEMYNQKGGSGDIFSKLATNQPTTMQYTQRQEPTYETFEFKKEPILQEYLAEAAMISERVQELRTVEQMCKNGIFQVGRDIKAIPIPLPPDQANVIESNLQELLKQAEGALATILHLTSTSIIDPKDLYALSDLRQAIYIQVQQLRLYQHELQYLKTSTLSSPARGFACLVVSKQPFPKTIKQLTKLANAGEDQVTVMFIKGAKTDVIPNGKAKAVLTFDDYQGKKTALEVQHDTQELDADNNAVFSNLRFPSGTRMRTVRLQFALDVKYSERTGAITTGNVESDSSAPFIVVTNENQWDIAAGVLLKKEAFDQGRKEIAWAHFANILQYHYIKATRQVVTAPQRPLSREELDYFQREKFDGKSVITQTDFDKFWEWFGKVLYKIRHQKHFCPMWVQGYVYGFLTKAEAENLLRNEPPGTFVLRFSERAAGKVAIAYVKKMDNSNMVEIKHYLIDPHNTENKDSVTLPEFLTPHAHFLYFLQLDTNFYTSKMSSKRRVSKNEVLRSFVGKDNLLSGYEKEIS